MWTVLASLASEATAECRRDNRPDTSLVPVSVRFEAGEVARNVVSLYETLWRRNVLPCRTIRISSEKILSSRLSIPLSALLIDMRILPLGYPSEMDNLICELNPKKCSRGMISIYREGDEFVVPDIQFREYLFNYPAKVLAGESVPDDVLSRVVPEITSMDRVKREEYLQLVKDRNLDYRRRLYNDQGEHVLYVPRRAYHAVVLVPQEAISNSFLTPNTTNKDDAEIGKEYSNEVTEQQAAQFIQEAMPKTKNITVRPMPSPGSIGIKTALSLPTIKREMDSLERAISFPDRSKMNGTERGVYVIDRGIQSDNVFLGDDEAIAKLSSSEINRALRDDTTCNRSPNENHGTHILGIIVGKIPRAFEGLARGVDFIGFDYNKIRSANSFERRAGSYSVAYSSLTPNQSQKLKVINMSIDLEENLRDSYSKLQAKDDFKRFVSDYRSHLFVVAAGHKLPPLEPSAQLRSPVSEYAADNVLVVTALNKNGDDLLEGANRNKDRLKPIVHIAAPGEDVLSICSNNSVGRLSGSSQATAIVSATAVLLMNEGIQHPEDIKLRLMYTADFLESLHDGVAAGRLNVKRAFLDWQKTKICLAAHVNPERTDCEQQVPGKGKVTAWKIGKFKWFQKMKDASFREVEQVNVRLSKGTQPVRTEELCRLTVGASGKFSVGICKQTEDGPRQFKKLANVDELYSEVAGDLFFVLKNKDGSTGYQSVMVLGDYVAALPD